jgi:hypothetical protein
MNKAKALVQLHADLGLKRLNPLWAKLEILVGLAAAGLGLFLGDWALHQTGEPAWPYLLAGLFLFVLGGYLAMAGHHSHLYQSNNELAAYLAEVIRTRKETIQSPR